MIDIAKGNMYDWATPWNPLAGECPHKCSYCSTKSLMFRPSCKAKYTGKLRLDDKAMKKNLGFGNTWFVCAQNDLWADKVPERFIKQIINHCLEHSENTYVFQTKNPARYFRTLGWCFPYNCIFGCTIESNRDYATSPTSPSVRHRMESMMKLKRNKFITIEPIIYFDLDIFVDWIKAIKPNFVNIGADSKRHNLPEPPADKIKALIAEIKNAGIEVKIKSNLSRLFAVE